MLIAEWDPIGVLRALGPLVTGLFLICIGFWQAETSHYKLKLDLFEKRIAVYRSLRAFLDDIAKKKAIWLPLLAETNKFVDEAEFLFSSDIQKFLKPMMSAANELSASRSLTVQISLGSSPLGPVSPQEQKLLNQFAECRQKLLKTFKRYLDFKKIR